MESGDALHAGGPSNLALLKAQSPYKRGFTYFHLLDCGFLLDPRWNQAVPDAKGRRISRYDHGTLVEIALIELQQVRSSISDIVTFCLIVPGHPNLESVPQFKRRSNPDIVYLHVNRTNVTCRPINEIARPASERERRQEQNKQGNDH